MIQNCGHEGREPSKTLANAEQVESQRRGMQPPDARFLSKSQMSAQLGVSKRTIDNWIAQKRIPSLRLSARMRRFNLNKVETALQRYEVKEIGGRR